jgi:hypothetical protein
MRDHLTDEEVAHEQPARRPRDALRSWLGESTCPWDESEGQEQPVCGTFAEIAKAHPSPVRFVGISVSRAVAVMRIGRRSGMASAT